MSEIALKFSETVVGYTLYKAADHAAVVWFAFYIVLRLGFKVTHILLEFSFETAVTRTR